MPNGTSELALEDLRKLTNKITSGVPEYEADMVWPLRQSTVEAYRLYREPQVAVLRACLPVGEPFPRHVHGEKQIIVVYSGCLGWKLHDQPPEAEDSEGFCLTVDDMDGILGPGGVLEVEAGVPHSVMAIDEELLDYCNYCSGCKRVRIGDCDGGFSNKGRLSPCRKRYPGCSSSIRR